MLPRNGFVALPIFAQTTAKEWSSYPGNPRLEAHDYRATVDAFRKAARCRLRRACRLDQMAKNGFGPPDVFYAQDDVIPLRSDPRWKPIAEQMTKNAHPCKLAPEYRQFDYWLGEWDVEIGGQKLASSSIQLILDECVIFENYTDSRGYAGKSFSIYDATSKRWEQRYVDTTGAFHTWTGGIENGRMVFYWKTPQGLQRMSYEKEGADRVRQLIDISPDDGKTWSPGYNGLYIRRK